MAFSGKRRNTELFMAELLTGADIAKCANRAGIGLRTAYRWWADAEFKQAFREKQKAVLERCTLQLTSEVSDAIRSLVEIHKDSAQPAAPRTSAALGIIKQGFLVSGLDQIEQRIATLEEQRKGNHNNPEE